MTLTDSQRCVLIDTQCNPQVMRRDAAHTPRPHRAIYAEMT